MSNSERHSRDSVNKIFGDPIPDTTSDERDDTRPDDDAERERWLRDNIPPHHG
jgi:hypothetical protein